MNRYSRRVDNILKATVSPVFSNPAHRSRLLSQLLKAPQEKTPDAVAARSGVWPRAGWIAATAAILLVTVVVAVRSSLAPRSVRAEVLVALEGIDSLVMTETAYRETASGSEQIPCGTTYFRDNAGLAVITPHRKGWNVHGDLYVYDVPANEVTLTRGIGTLPIKSSLGHYRLLAGFGHERDRGTVLRDGQALRLVEVVDEDDPTQRLEIYAQPDSMLPAEMLTYQRNDEHESWRLTREAAFQYNVQIDGQVFAPTYPKDAEVIEHAGQPLESAANSLTSGNATPDDWRERAVAIASVGDKFLAVEGVWRSPSGWFGLKFRTNLREAFVIPQGFREDPANQQRWQADEPLLHNLLGGTLLATDSGVQYWSHNGASFTRYDDGTTGHAFYYLPEWGQSPSDPVEIRHLVFRMLAVPRDRGRGESMSHYWDWKENPDQWHMMALTIPVPEPSENAPRCFNEHDLTWLRKTKVDEQARASWMETMRRHGRIAEAYDVVNREPEATRRLYGSEWLLCLQELGKQQEAYALYADASNEEKEPLGYAWMLILVDLKKQNEAEEYLDKFRKYCLERDGEAAESLVEPLKRLLKRLSQPETASAQGQ